MQNLSAGYDPTGVNSISGANLKALIEAATPYSDIGLVKVTTDVAGVPVVPNAVGTPELVRYVWLRILATSVQAYLWVPSAASDATYLKWQSITSSAIPDGAITNSKLGAAAVTDSKVNDVAASKITGTLNLAQLPATAGLIKVTVGNFTGAGTDINNNTITPSPVGATVPNNTQGALIGGIAMTPLSNTASLKIKFSGFLVVPAATDVVVFAWVDRLAASAACAVTWISNATASILTFPIYLEHWFATPGVVLTQINFYVSAGANAATHTYFNRTAGTATLFGAASKASLVVEEYSLIVGP